MIGSHDTFTYLEPVNPLFKLGKRWWKTQCCNIYDQYVWGVRFFDIRVYWDEFIQCWKLCHGLVSFKGYRFKALQDICKFMSHEYPKAIYRIVLERTTCESLSQFESQCDSLFKFVDNLWRCDVKSSGYWTGVYKNRDLELYKRGYKFACDLPWNGNCVEKHGVLSKSNWWKVSLIEEAEKLNKELFDGLTAEQVNFMKEDKTKLYLIDFSTLEYGRY